MNPSLQPLTKRQRKLVTKNPGTILAIAHGARRAMEECQFQFRNRRWECPTSDTTNGGSIFGKILHKGEGENQIYTRGGGAPVIPPTGVLSSGRFCIKVKGRTRFIPGGSTGDTTNGGSIFGKILHKGEGENQIYTRGGEGY